MSTPTQDQINTVLTNLGNIQKWNDYVYKIQIRPDDNKFSFRAYRAGFN